MSEPKFTPGPWEWSDQYLASTNEKTWSLIGSDGYGIMSCDGEANSPQCLGGIGEANAHLIAAAPELYEACEILFKITTGMMKQIPHSGFEPGSPLGKCEAALAKARGESND